MKKIGMTLVVLSFVATTACGKTPLQADDEIDLGELHVVPAITEGLHVGMKATYVASGGNGVYSPDVLQGCKECLYWIGDRGEYYISTPGIFLIRIWSRHNHENVYRDVGGGAK